MKIIQCIPNENKIASDKNVNNAVVLGNFDGLHLGHAELIRRATELENTKTYVYTFSENPKKFISSDPSAFKYLTTNEQKIEILAQMGVSYVCFEDFESVRDMEPEQFVKDVLIGLLHCDVAVCGYNFTFGKKGIGTSALLKEELAKYGAQCIVVSRVTYNGMSVNSTRIRGLIEKGEVSEAAELLGRPFTISRPVISGKKLGRELGVPTLNQSFAEDSIVPAYGVYVCNVKLDGKFYPGVCDVGTKPTVNGSEVLAETHIIGFDGDLYGKTIDVSFLKMLRPEKKFSDTDELKTVIYGDLAEAKKYFGITQ